MENGDPRNWKNFWHRNMMSVCHMGDRFEYAKGQRKDVSLKRILGVLFFIFIAVIVIILVVFGVLGFFSPSHGTDAAQSAASQYVVPTKISGLLIC